MAHMITSIDGEGKCKLKLRERSKECDTKITFKFENAKDIFSTAIDLLQYALIANYHDENRPFTHALDVGTAINDYIHRISEELYSSSSFYNDLIDQIDRCNQPAEKESDSEKEEEDPEQEEKEEDI